MRSKLTKRKLQAAPRCCQVKFAYLNLAKHASQKVYPPAPPPLSLSLSVSTVSSSLLTFHLFATAFRSLSLRCPTERFYAKALFEKFAKLASVRLCVCVRVCLLLLCACVCVCCTVLEVLGKFKQGILENFSRCSACK